MILDEIGQLQELLASKGSLQIIYLLNLNNCYGLRFSEIQKEIKVSFGAFYPTLIKLMSFGLIEKKHNVLYSLTYKGVSLSNLLFCNMKPGQIEKCLLDKKIIHNGRRKE